MRSNLFILLVFSFASISATADTDAVYPIRNCGNPTFPSCADWQWYWDKQKNYEWANCPWPDAALTCWDQNRVAIYCPFKKSGVPTHYGEIIRLHNWMVKVFHDAHNDDAWKDHPNVARAFQYANGLGIDPYLLGFAKQKEIEAEINSLKKEDVAYLASILSRYATDDDTQYWFNFALSHFTGCVNIPETTTRITDMFMTWQKLRDQKPKGNDISGKK